MSTSLIHEDFERIAIIGMSGRFPGAANIAQFWQHLCAGVESISWFTDEEMIQDGVSLDHMQFPNLVKAGAVLDNVTDFDAGFFGYTPKEAEIMDPQQRLFLETAWEALEHAGYNVDSYKGWVGVYGGVGINSYMINNLLPSGLLDDPSISLQLATANDRDYVTTRISYKLNLKGPSINVQTACSTAMVAVHLACQALLNYQCDMALAGGASVRAPQKGGYLYHEGGMYAADGRVHAFDADANGTVFSSGVGMVVLKRLSEALADGDQIYAVVKGTAINNDGALKVGFTAPSIEGQSDVLKMAQGTAMVHPETISYIEAHGTGTPLGDPIEIAALTQIFRKQTDKLQFCAIGSAKTNIGHTGAAAGAVGLIKTVMALHHRKLPPSLHFKTPNPKIDFASSPFYVNTSLQDWTGTAPLRAGVSSFGVGGTNAHIIVEEAPVVDPSGPSRRRQLLMLSARSEAALEQATTNLVGQLQREPEANLADVTYTLQVGRKVFNHRRMLVCDDVADAVAALEERNPKRVLSRHTMTSDPPLVFLFSGQGAQYVNMARDLYQTESVFRAAVDRCAIALTPKLGFDLRDVLYPVAGQEAMATDRLMQTGVTQPALFVIEYALAKLLMAWGIQPSALIGHSIGEYVAATLAGVFSLENALSLVAARGRLMQSLSAGAMLTVPLAEHQVQPLLGNLLSLAAINSPTRCVVSGPSEAVAALEQDLLAQGIDCRRLHTSHAFHSLMMEPILESFMECFADITLNAPTLPYISNVSGTWITADQATSPVYWAQHLRHTVRFADGLKELLQKSACVLLEVGPGQTLGTLVRQHPAKTEDHVVLSSLRHPNDQQLDDGFLLSTLGQLWLAGVQIDWSSFYADERRHRIALPTYPFERQRYWIDPPKEKDSRKHSQRTLHRRPDMADWFYIPSWKRSIAPVLPQAVDPACWLVFMDECGLGHALVAYLETQGHTVVTVAAGTLYQKQGPRSYTLRPAEYADYDTLLAELSAENLLPKTVVHLWTITPNVYTAIDAETLEAGQERGFYSLLYLAQVLSRLDLKERMRISVISNNMQKVGSELILSPEKSSVLGPCKVIPQEIPQLSTISIDVQLSPAGSAALAELVEQLVAELQVHSDDLVIAYRGYNRWVQTYEEAPLQSAIPGKDRLREAGVYLITGGLGGIGLVFAEHLARTVSAKLVLVSRSGFPSREEWDHWLEVEDEQDSVAQKIHKLRALEAMGSEILVINADASNIKHMQAVVDQTIARFGTIHGVIHAAGIAGGGVIQLKMPDVAAKVLAPKITAMRTLEAVLGATRLDFLVLCSSTIGIMGGFGQVDYCAANSFLDVFAPYYMERYGTFTVSINWDAWLEVGMAVTMASPQTLKEMRSQARYQKFDHPLLERVMQESPTQLHFMSELNPATQWVLAEHHVGGIPALPGTSYLEMARAAFMHQAKATTGAIEIQDAFFLTPLTVDPDTQTELHLILDTQSDQVEFRVRSKEWPKDAEDPRWSDHAFGKVAWVQATPQQQDIAAIRMRCNSKEFHFQQDQFVGAGNLVFWGPRWGSLRHIYVGVDEAIGELELPEEFVDDLANYVLHPALLDVATAFTAGLIGDGTYLPFSYHKLRVHKPLSRRIYSHSRFSSAKNHDKDLVTVDLTLMDEHGNQLVEIVRYTLKRVGATPVQEQSIAQPNQAGARGSSSPVPSTATLGVQAGAGQTQRPLNGTARKADTPPRVTKSGSEALLRVEGLTPAEGVEALMRVLSRSVPQVIVCTKDLLASIEQRRGTRENLLVQIEQRQMPKSMYARPDIQTAYVAPGTEAERTMAEIWQGVLGIDQVGIHDNFFDLGGDSVLAIQIIAKANAAGIETTPTLIFQHQTIAELLVAVGIAHVPSSEQIGTIDSIPLTPAQRRLLAGNVHKADTSSQTLLLSISPTVDLATLEHALQQVIQQHEALYLHFTRSEMEVQQSLAVPEPFPVKHIELSMAAPEEHRRVMAAELSAIQKDLQSADGQLLRLVMFSCGSATPSYLGILIHPLVTDSMSWRILLEDIQTAYRQLSLGSPVQLEPKTTSFKQWAKYLHGYAQSDEFQKEQDYWLALLDSQTSLPVDQVLGMEDQSIPATASLTVALNRVETSQLLEDLLPAYKNQIHEVLLAALAEAVTSWAGSRTLLIDVETDEGARRLGDLDLSRTIGPCTMAYPISLDLYNAYDPGTLLHTIKEQMRGVPNGGLGYGVLRHLKADAGVAVESLPHAPIQFCYHGHLLPDFDYGLFQVGSEVLHHSYLDDHYLMAVNAWIFQGELLVTWKYRPSQHYHQTIQRLADRFIDELRMLIAHGQSLEVAQFTPSDFPAAGLSQAELDQFMIDFGGQL
jgi:non-ribosomal peptide synthase protein (TIGR01720 family)